MTVRKLAIALFWVILAAGAAHALPSPTEQVSGEIDRIMQLLDNDDLVKQERNQQILELLEARFDFRTMSQWILGIHWRKATPDQRERFVELFTELLEATYRDRVEEYADRYTDETVEYVEERIREDKALVKTLVHTKNQAIPIDYKLVLRGEEWLVYDVVIEEVSLVSNFRSTYDEVVRNEGFDGLFARMEEKAANLRRGTGSESESTE